MSRFRTDHIVLAATDAACAAMASSLNAVPDGAQDFLLPPSVRIAVAEAEAKYRSISEFSLYVSHNDVEKSLSVSKNDTVAAVTKAAWKLFDLHLPESTIKLDDVRLRKYKIKCETKILGEPLTFAYKYNNIWVNITSQSPTGHKQTQLVNLKLADNVNGWLGAGMDDIFYSRIKITKAPVALKAGVYSVTIAQAMLDEPLASVLSSGNWV